MGLCMAIGRYPGRTSGAFTLTSSPDLTSCGKLFHTLHNIFLNNNAYNVAIVDDDGHKLTGSQPV